MGWLISALGLILASGGATSLAYGANYIRLDWGATEVVAGTTALSAGIVTLALGAVLFALRGLAPRNIAASGLVATVPAMQPAVGEDRDIVIDPPGDAPRSPRGGLRSRLASVGMPRAGRPDPAPEGPGPVSTLVEPGDHVPDLEPAPAMRFARPAAPEPDARAMDEAPHSFQTLEDGPTVVGRYEANGASYVLFSDGTIEVETETGTHRFASMGDLKDHIERQDAG